MTGTRCGSACTPRLELRLPTEDELRALAEVARAGRSIPRRADAVLRAVDRPRAPAGVRRRVRRLPAERLVDWTRRCSASSSRTVRWACRPLAHRRAGVVDTGSWLGAAGRTAASASRCAAGALELAFRGLDYAAATSGAFVDNPQSRRVSRRSSATAPSGERHTHRATAGRRASSTGSSAPTGAPCAGRARRRRGGQTPFMSRSNRGCNVCAREARPPARLRRHSACSPRLAASAAPPRRGHPQDPPRRRDHAGEPLVRLLLRHVSRAPTGSRCGTACRRLRARPGDDGAASGRTTTTFDRQRRRPARPRRRGQRHRRTATMNGFIRQERRGGCAPATASTTRAAARDRDAQEPDVMGYHDGREIPNYWAYARNFVLQDHMFQPDTSWSLPAHLFLVSGWSAKCAQADDPASCRDAVAEPGRAARRAAGPDRRRPGLRVDRPHLPPAPAPRQLALLRRQGRRARLRGRRDVLQDDPAEREDARDLEPAALVRRPSSDDRQRRDVAPFRRLLARRAARHAPRRLVGHALAEGQRASAGLVTPARPT